MIPVFLGVYFLQSLDKSSLAYASVFDLEKGANLKGEDYSWLGSIVYIAQLALQFPVAYALVKFPAGKLAGIMVLLWGAVLLGMAFAESFKGLMALRFFLGAFEAFIGQ